VQASSEHEQSWICPGSLLCLWSVWSTLWTSRRAAEGARSCFDRTTKVGSVYSGELNGCIELQVKSEKTLTIIRRLVEWWVKFQNRDCNRLHDSGWLSVIACCMSKQAPFSFAVCSLEEQLHQWIAVAERTL
jgi:hypothetical protein